MLKRQKILYILAFLISFIFLINAISHKFYWYQSIWWFDMPMHFAGGVAILLLLSYIKYNYLAKPINIKQITLLILGVLIIGVGWEVFEYLTDIFISHQPQIILDTISDIFFDLSGAIFGALYIFDKSSTRD